MTKNIDFYQYPDELGFFGQFGGQYISETLMQAVLDLQENYETAKEAQLLEGI